MEPGDAFKLLGGTFVDGAVVKSPMGRVAVVQNDSVFMMGGGGHYPIQTLITLQKLEDDWCHLHGIDRTTNAISTSRGTPTDPSISDPCIRPPQAYSDRHRKVSADGCQTGLVRTRTSSTYENTPRSNVGSACWSEIPRLTGHWNAGKISDSNVDLSHFNAEQHPHCALECLAMRFHILDVASFAVGKEFAGENLIMIIPQPHPGLLGGVLGAPSTNLLFRPSSTVSAAPMEVDPLTEPKIDISKLKSNLVSRPLFHPSYTFISPCDNYEESVIDMAWLATPTTQSQTDNFIWSQYLVVAIRDTLQFWLVQYTCEDSKETYVDKHGKATLVYSFSPFLFPSTMQPATSFGLGEADKPESSTKIIEQLHIIPSSESSTSSSLLISFRNGHLANYTISFKNQNDDQGNGEPVGLDYYGLDEDSEPHQLGITCQWKISIPELSSSPLALIRSLSLSDTSYTKSTQCHRDLSVLTPGISVSLANSLSSSTTNGSAFSDIFVLSSGGRIAVVSEKAVLQAGKSKLGSAARDGDGFVHVLPSMIVQGHIEAVSSLEIIPNEKPVTEGTIQFQVVSSSLDGWIRTWRLSHMNDKEGWKCDLINEQEFTMLLEAQAGAKEQGDSEEPNALQLLQLPPPPVAANDLSLLSTITGMITSPNGLYGLACASPSFRVLQCFHYLFYIRLLPNSIVSAFRSVSAKYAANWNPLTISIWDICTLAKSLPLSALSRLISHITGTFPNKASSKSLTNHLLTFPFAETFTLNAVLSKWLQTNLMGVSITEKEPGKGSKAIKIQLKPNKKFENPIKTLFIERIPELYAKYDSSAVSTVFLALIQLRSAGFLQHIVNSLTRLSLHRNKNNVSTGTSPLDGNFVSLIDTKALSQPEWSLLVHFMVLLTDALTYLPEALLPIGDHILSSLDCLISQISHDPSQSATNRLKTLVHLKSQNNHQLEVLEASGAPHSLEALFESSLQQCGYCEGYCTTCFPSTSFPLFALSSSKLSDDLSIPCPELDLPISYCSASGIPIDDILMANGCVHCGGLTHCSQALPSWVSSSCPFCYFVW